MSLVALLLAQTAAATRGGVSVPLVAALSVDEQCFVALKPDAVQRNLLGECISR